MSDNVHVPLLDLPVIGAPAVVPKAADVDQFEVALRDRALVFAMDLMREQNNGKHLGGERLVVSVLEDAEVVRNYLLSGAVA